MRKSWMLASALLYAVLCGSAWAVTPLSGEFLLEPSQPSKDSYAPQVAVYEDGRSVAVWEHQFAAGDIDIFFQRFGSNGLPVGIRTIVDNASANQQSPHIALRLDGGFVVAYRNATNQLVVKRYDSLGAPLAGAAGTANAPAMVVTALAANESLADFDIAISSTGQEVLVWATINTTADSHSFKLAPPSGVVTILEQKALWKNTLLQLAPDDAGNFILGSLEAGATDFNTNTDYRIDLVPILPNLTLGTHSLPISVGPYSGLTLGGVEMRLAAWGYRKSMLVYPVGGGQLGDPPNYQAVSFDGPTAASAPVPLLDKAPLEALDCTAQGRCVLASSRPAYLGAPLLELIEFTAAGRSSQSALAVTTRSVGQAFIDADEDGDMVVVWQSARADGSPGTAVHGRRYSGSEPVDLVLTQTDVQDPVTAPGRADYYLNVRNQHARPSSSLPAGIGQATNLVLVDTVPSGASFASASGADWSCAQNSGVVECKYGKPLAPLASTGVTLSFNIPGVTGPSLVANDAYVLADQEDPNQGNNADVETTSLSCGTGTFAFAFGNVNVSENVGLGIVNVSVVRTGGCGAATVQVVSSDESASVHANDYEPVASTLHWAAGEFGSQEVLVQINDDNIDEANEKLRLRLVNPVNGVLDNPAESLVTINDNDAAPKLRWWTQGQTVNENVDATVAVLKLSMVSGRDVTVNLTPSGTASAASDYQLDSTTVVIPAGWTEIQVPIAVDEDAIDESNETVILTLGAPVNAGLADHRTVHTVTIVDNDESAPVTVAFTQASGSVGEATSSRNIPVALSASTGQTVTVNYSVTGGNATGGGVDYTLANGTLTFTPGQTSKNIGVSIANDALDEGSFETVIVTLSAPSNATLGTITEHSLKILDDD